MAMIKQKCMDEEIKSRLNSGTACYHFVKNLLSVLLISKKIKITIYRTINLHLVYGRETWSSSLLEEDTQKVFEDRCWETCVGTSWRK